MEKDTAESLDSRVFLQQNDLSRRTHQNAGGRLLSNQEYMAEVMKEENETANINVENVGSADAKSVGVPDSINFMPASKSGLEFKLNSEPLHNGRTVDFTSNQRISKDGSIMTRGYDISFIKTTFNEDTGQLFIDKMQAQPGHHIGREMISNVVETIGVNNIKSIGAEFSDTNLEVFKRSLDSGLSSTDAAKNTPFGKALNDLGLGNVPIQVKSDAYPRPTVKYTY